MTVLSWEAGSGARTATPAVSGTAKLASTTAKLTAEATATASTTSSQPVINCPSGFASTASTGVCPVALGGNNGGTNFSLVDGSPGSLATPRVLLMPTGSTHLVEALNWQQQVNVQAFTASFTFVPNGQNVAFVLNNNNAPAGFNGAAFVGGAGCEAGFFQGFPSSANWPNNVFALELDSYSYLTLSSGFVYSSTQIYQYGQSPCLPNDSAPDYTAINKISIGLNRCAVHGRSSRLWSSVVLDQAFLFALLPA
jgi:hypothetical protein